MTYATPAADENVGTNKPEGVKVGMTSYFKRIMIRIEKVGVRGDASRDINDVQGRFCRR